jgi:hypothetical protein
MLKKHLKTQLSIVTEAVLEKALVREVRERGAQTWLVSEVHGGTREGARAGDWEADRSIELRVICDEAVADTIAQHVLATYANNFSVVMSFAEVQVLRPDRY